MNKFIGMGRIVREPEVRNTPSGKNVATFTIAINRRFKNKDGGYDSDFLNCVAWGQTGDFIAKFFPKGSLIAVEGSVQTRNWEDKEGNKRVNTDIVVEAAYFTGEKKGDNKQTKKPVADDGFYDDTDTPFDL